MNDMHRGDEAGYFAFGGSTVILLFPAHTIAFDEDLLRNSKSQVETLVKMGVSLGTKQ
jgi:phosphatidylserine decarboxylase